MRRSARQVRRCQACRIRDPVPGREQGAYSRRCLSFRTARLSTSRPARPRQISLREKDVRSGPSLAPGGLPSPGAIQDTTKGRGGTIVPRAARNTAPGRTTPSHRCRGSSPFLQVSGMRQPPRRGRTHPSPFPSLGGGVPRRKMTDGVPAGEERLRSGEAR